MGYIGTKPQTATQLADGIVTADKIVAGAVTDAKIAAMAASKLTGQLPDANAPSGSVIQVVSTAKTNVFTTTSTSFTDITGFSVSITPSSASNKILVLVDLCASQETLESYAKLVRNSTDIYIGDAVGSALRATSANLIHIGGGSAAKTSMVFLDSPNTTSSTTYKVQVRTRASGTLKVNINNDNTTAASDKPVLASSITVMEIAA
jgi:hypothetical protein